MSKLIIHGGNPLKWTIRPVANKNSILKLIPACVLTDETCTIRNVPQTSDVKYLLQILEKLWWQYWRKSENVLEINCSKINSQTIDPELSEKMKAGVMFAWPLLTKFGKVSMPMPQWCKLWTRPMDVMVENMTNMWAKYEYKNGAYNFFAEKLIGNKIWQWFPSVTGTENLILMAVMAQWETEIYNAGCEPHTQDLCNMLVSMWAKISWIWSNKLIINWIKTMKWTDWTVISDHLDVWWYIVASAVTWWEVKIKNSGVEHLGLIIQMMNKLWVEVQVDQDKDEIFIPSAQKMTIQKTVKDTPRRTHAFAWPLLPPDFVHSCVILALKSSGQAIFDNLYYEYSWFFVQELAKMKANIFMANPVTVITTWPTEFKPADLNCSDIIQASFGLFLATLSAKWKSTLNSINPLFRRFPDFIEKYNSIGANIEMVE